MSAVGMLANIVWHCLAGPHIRFSTGTATARRYAAGFSPLIGFAEPERPDFAALTPHCLSDEHFYSGGWSGEAPAGWRVELDSSALQMVWEGPLPEPDAALDPVPLAARDVPQMLELVTLTQPGPFADRTIELGQYFGVFEAGRLIAMAGERMFAGRLREVSGVCTHPAFQGRGLARRLVAHLIRLQMQRNEVPFLHVMKDNINAQRLYKRMGFVERAELIVRVVARTT